MNLFRFEPWNICLIPVSGETLTGFEVQVLSVCLERIASRHLHTIVLHEDHHTSSPVLHLLVDSYFQSLSHWRLFGFIIVLLENLLDDEPFASSSLLHEAVVSFSFWRLFGFIFLK